MMALMTAMQLDRPGTPLRSVHRAIPRPGRNELLLEVTACGVCRTDLHVVDGEVSAHHPVIPGHEVVGRVLDIGSDVTGFEIGARVGVPWLGSTCGSCPRCKAGHENLCDQAQFTGATRDGGYATHMVAHAHYCFVLPERFSDAEAAPLLCAGLIGWRALRFAGAARRIGLYGFGAAAHILAQVALWQGREVYAFTRDGDAAGQDFARTLGCSWAGGSTEVPPVVLDAALIFAPVGELVPIALKAVDKGGSVVCAGIHMSDIPTFPYADLWGERRIVSVANLTREDGVSFLDVADRSGLRPIVTLYSLAHANDALKALRVGEVEGAAVLVPSRQTP